MLLLTPLLHHHHIRHLMGQSLPHILNPNSVFVESDRQVELPERNEKTAWSCMRLGARKIIHLSPSFKINRFLQIDQHPGRLLKEDSQCHDTAGCGGTSYGVSAIQHGQNIESSVKSKDKLQEATHWSAG